MLLARLVPKFYYILHIIDNEIFEKFDKIQICQNVATINLPCTNMADVWSGRLTVLRSRGIAANYESIIPKEKHIHHSC